MLKTLKIYSGDFSDSAWADITDQLGISYTSESITIQISSFESVMPVYCALCDSAYILTKENKQDLYYCCDHCRDSDEIEYPKNNFKTKLVVDYCN